MATPNRTVRILLLADSHLGFDHPLRPKIRRRRRGLDFMASYRRACQTAIEERVDLLVHGGDVFHTPTVPASLVYQGFEPLKEVADSGIPVLLVPGNHERSRIPFDWLARHPGVHVFKEAATVRLTLADAAVAISGIPCIGRHARKRFRDALDRTRWRDEETDLRLLIAHQAFEGAVVGPADFRFRKGDDVVRVADVPGDFAAVLAGHIHRSQVLETDLRGRPCPAPVLYPGSLERTSFAERGEPKGFMMLEMTPSRGGGSLACWTFRDLEVRPMEIRPLRVRGLPADALERELRRAIAAVSPDAVLRLEADGAPAPDAEKILAARRLRSLAPESMNLEVVVPGLRRWSPRPRTTSRSSEARTSRRSPPDSAGPDQGTLF